MIVLYLMIEHMIVAVSDKTWDEFPEFGPDTKLTLNFSTGAAEKLEERYGKDTRLTFDVFACSIEDFPITFEIHGIYV